MYPNRALRSNSPPLKGLVGSLWLLLLVLGLGRALPTVSDASAEGCANTVVADVVVLDQPLMFNRLGAQNVNSMVYALQRDVIAVNPSTREPTGDLPGTNLQPGAVELRPDKRPRPLVLRVNAGDCLQVNFTNLLASAANPNTGLATHENLEIDDQVADRMAGFHPQGMQLVGGIDSDSSFVGQNANSLVAPGDSRTYTFLAPPREGTFLVTSHGATFGGEATGGNLGNGMFAAINVEPPGADYFRSQVTEEELRLATQKDSEGNLLTTADGHPLVDYDALYPNVEPWTSEGKAGLPVLRMTTLTGARGTLVHSDINAIIAHRSDGGSLGNFPPSTYPLESQGKRNPTVPNRLEPFREFTSVFHDEVAVAQAFPGWFEDEVLSHTLHGVRDGFMINYGSGGIGSEIIANRLGVGPMHDCLHCTYEEFFLASSTVGDPAMLVDVPANDGLEALGPGQAPSPGTTGPKAHRALYPDDPANVHHSYTNDFTKIRNLHAGPKEHHIFHLHNHQWLFNANDDNANYLDAQGLGPGSGYTYEINFGGSGNRNKTAGDAIYHCHFYPHFAQGMWYLWRNHDVFEAGTRLAVTGNPNDPQAFHTTSFALSDGTPALVADLDNNGTLDARARALPDGEILAGTPIPALVPLPGKPMAPLPGRVMVVTKDADGNGSPDSSQAKVDRDDKYTSGSLAGQIKNPGYPFWIAGIEHTVGQRPPNPPLDMLTESEAEALNNSGNPLWSKMSTAVAGGWNGGLPRLSLEGYLAGGESLDIQNRLDFSKEVLKGKPVYYPEEGTDVEQAAMAFHAQRCHGTFLPDGSVANCVDTNGDGRGDSGGFITNGAPPVPSAPYHDPCIDDEGDRFLTGQPGQFFSVNGLGTTATPEYGADNPRVYKAANIQLDVVLNKVGYHFPQQRIITLWEDVDDTLNKVRPPEPFVMRLNTFDCAKYLHTNLVPHIYELDDYQVRTDTDVIGQHIHLPKWDLTSADGSGNGWNYEDGTLSPGTVREEIEAINCYNGTGPCPEGIAPGPAPVATLPQPNGTGGGLTQLEARPHPFFGDGGWLGARTTIQRWFADPVVNVAGVDRGLGIIFTHDHFGPSTHQQVGLYSTLLIEPARSTWVHNETGEPLGTRHDGGPTSWQAAILTGDLNGDGKNDSYREFYFEYSDFQHAYEAGFGADGNGNPVPPTEESFRHAINPSVRQEADPVFPDLVLYPPVCPGGVPRPCPEAISADDPGMFVVNYRNEP
ncbi:MAG: hypothetical protein HYY20_04690, partial [Candidatus Tectomicrobia bacterium]|nr:hypothetical protein [Candidatus Tectomicrobia bacterium]